MQIGINNININRSDFGGVISESLFSYSHIVGLKLFSMNNFFCLNFLE